MPKNTPRPAAPKKKTSEAERVRRKQTFFVILLSVLIAVSMLLSLLRYG